MLDLPRNNPTLDEKMRYGEFKAEQMCHTKGMTLTNDKGDSFTSVANPALDEYSFINERTKEVITVKLVVSEEDKG
jgi:hypothetical protein